MFLEKLEIQGFKSFANKNILIFPGLVDKDRRGITAVVGPNGSGKSNIADAVRWSLGEQSMKILRGKRSEDIIFSGSDKKGKLGMAEVSLFLNNEDGQVGTDYSQIVLTRRLYRDGASDYLINNSRVRLSDIQLLLAKANFGQKTYSVIGQGMVEGFLNTSLAERKEFFDEATGVKQFQIKRDEALNKLLASYENLNQAGMLLAEIEPRLKNLTRQVNKLKKRGEIEAELKSIQLNYYGKLWNEINNKLNDANKRFLELEKIKSDKEKKLTIAGRELEQMEKNNQSESEFTRRQLELSQLQSQKDLLVRQAAKLDAQMELKLEASGQFDLAWLTGKHDQIKKELAAITEETGRLEKSLKQEETRRSALEEEKKQQEGRTKEINQELAELNTAPKDLPVKELAELMTYVHLAEEEIDLEKVRELINKIKLLLQRLQTLFSTADDKKSLAVISDNLMKLTEAKEDLSGKINESNLRLSAGNERVRLIGERKKQIEDEFRGIGYKLEQSQKVFDQEENASERKKIKQDLMKLEEEITAAKDKLNAVNAKAEEKRNRFYGLQKNSQNLQNEVNLLINQLNELKINSTRHETRLEDLEIEIRNSYGQLKEVKDHKLAGGFDSESALEKINSLKKQIDQIGGIDPEIEKEYLETKERYDFLSTQTNDLSSAIESLEKIIRELDFTIKERFDKEFKMISLKFEEYFKILFNGGQARIMKVLAEEDNQEEQVKENQTEQKENLPETRDKLLMDSNIKKIRFLQKHNATGLAGIEIQATPPGKKIKSVAMLSGGERALTAIAMICAIINSNPSPFVFLDEVDASLDEANSERLAKILDDLSHRTQFIAITHNRATMRRANILYGVTMEDNGVSKLLSVKLEEVKVV